MGLVPSSLLALSVLLATNSDLTELSLEELMDVVVTSVSKTEEPRSGAAAAVTVLTREDLRRSGATTVPEALRLVPGLHVSRVSANIWEVAARGFSSVNSAKLLVLSDTRSIYSPLFSGVFWDVQDQLFEDIERIEVIRGPGGSLWGSNAVNGVINITTRSSKDTQGVLLEAGAGTEERAFGTVRYGGKVGEQLHFRVFGRYVNRDGGFLAAGPGTDDWWLGRGGLRADWALTGADVLTVQADGYRGDVGRVKPSVTVIGRPGPTPPLRVIVSGANVLARWVRTLSPTADLQLRAYYDRSRRDDPSYRDVLQTADVDLQHRFALPLRQEILWGASYRLMADLNEGRGIFALEPPGSRDQLVSGFVQDQLTILDGLRLTAGTKLEHNDFSGFEVQPSGRVAWDFWRGHTAWGAVSRAVRVPTRLERDVAVDAADPASPILPRLLGNPAFQSEELIAYELGYRWAVTKWLFVDAAGFYNRYQGLASLELGEPYTADTGQLIVPVHNQNLTDGVAKGAELSVHLNPVSRWRMGASYSNLVLTLTPRGQDLNRGQQFEGASPRHQLSLYSWLDLPANFHVDVRLRHVGRLGSEPEAVAPTPVPAYTAVDARLSWTPARVLEAALMGQSLLDAHHTEFNGGTEVERGVYLTLTSRL